MARRHTLRDDQWERLKNLLPGREGAVGVIAKDNRHFVEAVLYWYRAGIPCRDLPKASAIFASCTRVSAAGAKTGVWGRVFEHLAQDADNEYAMIDTTIVRAHQQRRRAKKTAIRPQQRRIEHKNPRHSPRVGQSDRLPSHARTGA